MGQVPKYHYGQFGPEHLQLIIPGLELFNKKFYWECHEALEDLWLQDISDNARLVYWAIIQVAASLIHVRDEKIIGALGMLTKANEKLNKCEKLNVETPELLENINWNDFKQTVRSIKENPSLEDFKLLYEFKFIFGIAK